MSRLNSIKKKQINLGYAQYFNKKEYNQSMKTSNNINIVFAIDDNYIQQCAVTITSILANSKYENFYTFYILNTGLKNENKDKLNDLTKIRNFCINYVDVSNYDISKFPLNRGWISGATYYRLFLADVLPESIDKCIYMDCDMIAEDDLSDLWSFDIENYFAGVVEDESSTSNIERLGLPQENNYFNAGMILFNLKKLRTIDLFAISIKYYNENAEKITMQDQDILNGVLNGKCLFLPLKWNLNTPAYIKWYPKHNYSQQEEDNAALNPGILHFTGIYKPWKTSSMHPLRGEYKKYLELTEFYDDIRAYRIQEFISKIICKQEDWRGIKLYILGIPVFQNIKQKYNFLENLFSAKNSADKKHKIITVLGIKIKIRKRNK